MTTPSGSTTPTAGDRLAPSTEPVPAALPAAPLPVPVGRAGDTVLVRLDQFVWRPLLVTTVAEQAGRVCLSGMLVVEPGDYLWEAFRGGRFDGRIHSRRIDGLVFLAYGEQLTEGDGIGQWRRRD